MVSRSSFQIKNSKSKSVNILRYQNPKQLDEDLDLCFLGSLDSASVFFFFWVVMVFRFVVSLSFLVFSTTLNQEKKNDWSMICVFEWVFYLPASYLTQEISGASQILFNQPFCPWSLCLNLIKIMLINCVLFHWLWFCFFASLSP